MLRLGMFYLNVKTCLILVDPETVIAGAELGFGVLQAVLGALASESRKIAIGIDNESLRNWASMNVYFRYGTSTLIIPDTVKSGKN